MPEVEVEVWGFGEILASLAGEGSTTAQMYLEGVNIPRSTILETMRNAGWQQLGGEAGNTFYRAVTAEAGNGLATTVNEVSTLAVTETGTTTALTTTSTGAGLLGVEVGAAGLAIAPALGILAGVGLYNLAPEFWTGVSNALMNAGKLVGDKVQGIINKDGTTSFDEETIEIFKNAFLEAGLFEVATEFTPDPNYQFPSYVSVPLIPSSIITLQTSSSGVCKITPVGDNVDLFFSFSSSGTDWDLFAVSDSSFRVTATSDGGRPWFNEDSYIKTYDGMSKYTYKSSWSTSNTTLLEGVNNPNLMRAYRGMGEANFWRAFFHGTTATEGEHVQEDATLPDNNPFPQTYPSWLPNKTIENNNYYPISMPTGNITQQPSQTGQNDTDEQQQSIVDFLYYPQPEPIPQPEPDPDPQPEPEPEPEPESVPEQADPIDPNPSPEDSDIVAPLPILDSLSADALFTVYNPTDGQLNSLGSYLWTSNIIEQIKQIWQNPIEGVIALHKIYGAPSTGSAKNIKLGYLDTGVSSLVVTNQFTEIDCGSININENKQNATDYAPFTQIQIYLPFVGIYELDTNEIMNGTLHVKYRIDVYTGTCLAMIYCTRNPDMTTEQLLYTYSGNASQTIPLTSSNFAGALGSLLGVVGVGVASGGALGAVAAGAAHSLTSDMVHIQHSGGLSANSGLLAPRTPFVIISRQYGYDANGYAGFYGLPANKTVFLSNCTGYVRVKDIHYKGNGTNDEVNEIISLLKSGIIL